jgi:hypothetical protein
VRYNAIMDVAALRRDTYWTMRQSPRARSVGSLSRLIRKKLVTTTYTYDNNGNVIQVGTTTFYTYDYANRLTQSAIRIGNATTTTTYAYGAFGNRVSQTAASTTFRYPSKFFSVASSTGTGARYATTADYVFAGSSLLATVDRQIVSGTATGTAITRYNHTDNLGSTNVTSDATMNLLECLVTCWRMLGFASTPTRTCHPRQGLGC